MRKNKIPFNENLNITAMMVDNTTVNEWNLQVQNTNNFRYSD